MWKQRATSTRLSVRSGRNTATSGGISKILPKSPDRFPSASIGHWVPCVARALEATNAHMQIKSETCRIAALALAVIASGCIPHHSDLQPPYLVGGTEYTEVKLQALATDRCRGSSGALASLPPNPFTTDGCSLVPNGPMTECCIEHDMAYWCGGPSVLRSASDEALSSCIVRVEFPYLALVRNLTSRVRAGIRSDPLCGSLPYLKCAIFNLHKCAVFRGR